MGREYVKIYCCGDCIRYDWKMHCCRMGAKDEGKASDTFYRDCPLGICREDPWHNISRGKLPKKEGRYLTYCKYRNGSTAVKVKEWKDYHFTTENVNVFFWAELPPDPEG